MNPQYLFPRLAIAFAIGLLSGCTTTVNLSVKNASKVPLSIVADEVGSSGAKVGNEVSIGDVQPDETKSTSFVVHNKNSFNLAGSAFNQAVVYQSGSVYVSGDTDPFNYAATAIVNQGRTLDDTQGLQTISKSFKNLGPDIGAQPVPVKNALDTRIGALLVAIPGTDNTPGKILLSIAPGILGVKVNSLEDVAFAPTSENGETVMSGSASVDVSGKYGPIAAFNFNFSKSSTYDLKWTLRGFSIFNKIEDPTKDPVTQFNKLSKDQIFQITNALSSNHGSKLYYINSAYILQNAEMSLKEAHDITTGASADAASVVTAKGVVTFKDSQEHTSSYGPVVLNYFGDEYHLASVPKDTALHAIGTGLWTDATGKLKLMEESEKATRNEAYLLIPGEKSVKFPTRLFQKE